MSNLPSILTGSNSDSSYDRQAERHDDKLIEELNNLEQKIKNDDSIPQYKKDKLVQDIQKEKRRLGEITGDASDDIHGTTKQQYNTSVDVYHNTKSEYKKAKASAASSQKGGSKTGQVSQDPPSNSKVDSPDDSAKSDGSTSPDDSSDGSGIGDLEYGDRTIDEMINEMNDNPNEVMNDLDSLPQKKRMEAMQMLQKRLQQINQMFSMISNMMKTQHQTNKAMINNMRA